MVLYRKLYDIDRNGLKKMQKKWKPLFQYSKQQWQEIKSMK